MFFRVCRRFYDLFAIFAPKLVAVQTFGPTYSISFMAKKNIALNNTHHNVRVGSSWR